MAWRRRSSAAAPKGDATVTAPADPVLRTVDDRLADAEARLTTAAGDRSLCDLSRAGAPGGVKELEGRSAALREARRGIRAAAGEPAPAVVTATLGRWRDELALDASRGPVWERYRLGGIDELERLLDDLEAPPVS